MKHFLVYYLAPTARNHICTYPEDLLTEQISEADFDKHFIPVMDIEAKNKEEAFIFMQGEHWSPNGEAREAIKAYGLDHTSMSIGDVLFDREKEKYFITSWIGFQELIFRN